MKYAAASIMFLTAMAVSGQSQSPCIDVSSPSKHRASMPQPTVSKAARIGGMRTSATIDIPPTENICPLTGSQKFHIFVKDSVSPFNLISAAFNAGISQAVQGRHGYGAGWNAYGSRFGAALANSESSGFFQSFLLPSLLHEDPRYFRLASGGKWHRAGYALSRAMVARTDEGRHRFNYSEVIGTLVTAGLSNAYYVDSDRTVERTFGTAGLNVFSDAGWNLLKEFGPDLGRRLKRKKKTTD